MARRPKTTLWMLIKVVPKKRYVRVDKAADSDVAGSKTRGAGSDSFRQRDKGPEFIARAVRRWLAARNVGPWVRPARIDSLRTAGTPKQSACLRGYELNGSGRPC